MKRGVSRKAKRAFGDFLVVRQCCGASQRRRRNQFEAVRKCLRVQIALQRTQTEFRMELGNRAELGPGIFILSRAACEQA